jgi:hypothetical protein
MHRAAAQRAQGWPSKLWGVFLMGIYIFVIDITCVWFTSFFVFCLSDVRALFKKGYNAPKASTSGIPRK